MNLPLKRLRFAYPSPCPNFPCLLCASSTAVSGQPRSRQDHLVPYRLYLISTCIRSCERVFKSCTVDRLYVRSRADICMMKRQRATLDYGGSPANAFFFLLRRRFLREWLSVPSGAIDGGPVRLRMVGKGRTAFSVHIAPVGDRGIGRQGRDGIGDVGDDTPLPGAATRC